MKVLLVSPYFVDSYKNNLSMGSAVKLATNLSDRMEIMVLTSGRRIKDEWINKNLRVISVGGFLIPDPVNYMISFELLTRFISLVKLMKPEVVIVSKYMFFSSLVIPLARLMRVPVITVTDTFPGINWFPVSVAASVVMWIYARIIGLPLLWMSDKVILLYKGLELVARRYHLNYETIPNGVESKYLGEVAQPKDINKPKGEFWVGFVGRPESVKGYDRLLELASMCRSNNKIKFVIAGGDLKPKMVDNKMFLGFRKDIMNVYQTLDVLVLPSHAEGLPNVVMEAMACGVPVIAMAVGGVVEIIKNGENGFLVPSGSVKEIKKKVLELYDNKALRGKLSVAARGTIKSKYNWDKILDSYIRLIGQVCAG